MAPRAGTRIHDDVTLLRPLARGGMGSVWVARHRKLETEVAVKFLSAGLGARDRTAALRFRKEAALSAQLRSPHVVRTFDHGEMDDGRPYLVMELLEGETLTGLLARCDTMAPSDVVALVAQIGQVLDEAHLLGIVHRDIKPDNVFLVDAGDELFVKVLDFGIAKEIDVTGVSEVTSPGTLVGTPETMSPEQLLHPRTAEPQSDRWSLAVVAYRALVGRMPFTGETLASLSLAICHADYTPPSEAAALAPEVDAFFARAFALEPAQRFESARAMTEALSASLTGLPMPVRATPRRNAASPTPTWLTRSSVTIAGAAADVAKGAPEQSERRRNLRLFGMALLAALGLGVVADASWRRAVPKHVAHPSAPFPPLADLLADGAPTSTAGPVVASRAPDAAPPSAEPTQAHTASPAARPPLTAGGQRKPLPSAASAPPSTASLPKPGCENPFQLDQEGDLVPKPGCM